MKLRKKLVACATSGAALAAVTLMTASPASAADYSVKMDQACRYQHNSAYTARYFNIGDPFSWVCGYQTVTVGLPPSVSATWNPVDGVDVQRYCGIAYPGSRAVVQNWNAFGWRCRK